MDVINVNGNVNIRVDGAASNPSQGIKELNKIKLNNVNKYG